MHHSLTSLCHYFPRFGQHDNTFETCLVYVFIGVNVIDEEGSLFDQLRANLNRQSRFFQLTIIRVPHRIFQTFLEGTDLWIYY